MKSQKEVWNNIAQEWYEFREEPKEEVIKFLKSKYGKILDLGCGSGRNFIKIKGVIYGVDFSKKMIELAKKRAEQKGIDTKLFVSGISKLPFQDNFFDSAICISVLHCIPKKEKREETLKELYRVLKPNTQALISVWNKNLKRFKNSQKEKYIRWRDKGERYYYLYDKQELEELLKNIEFKIIKSWDGQNIIFIVQKN